MNAKKIIISVFQLVEWDKIFNIQRTKREKYTILIT